MRPSQFRNARDNIPTPVDIEDWQHLVQWIGTHRILPHDEKTNAPALCPAEWPDGATRAKKTVRAVHFLAMDYDKLTQAEFDATLEAADGLQCLLYTTWSHATRHAKDGTWSFRTVTQLSRPVTPDEWPRFWLRANARLGGLADPRCKDPSRIYFMPTAPSPEGCVVEIQEGVPLDVDATLGDAEPAPLKEERLRVIGKMDLEDLASRLNRKAGATYRSVGHAIKAALNGEAFAVTGDRDQAMFRIACTIAEEWPDGDPSSIAMHFARGIEAMKALSPECPDLEILREKIERKQNDIRAERAAQEEERRAAQATRIRAAFAGARTTPYTEDELDQYAKDAGVTRAEFMRRWIIMVGNSFYIFKGGSYGPSVTKDELWLTCERDLSAAMSAGVRVWKVNDQGDIKPRTVQDLVSNYAEAASRVVADLNAQRSWYDAKTATLVEAPCPRRDLDPIEPKPLVQWLEVLGGDQFETLKDWLAVCADLSEPIAALYLDGGPGTGKTLLGEALSRIWTTNGPTPMADVVGNFNEALLECPLILADEVLPDVLKKTEGTGALRQLIQARQQKLRRKFRPTATVKGCVRVVLAANNRHLLDTSEILTLNDADAVAERVLYIQIPSETRRVLEALPPDVVASFNRGDLLARYAMWLRQNRKVIRRGRFLVSGKDSLLHKTLGITNGLASALCCWCVRYLLEPGKMDATGKFLARVHKGQLLVNARGPSEFWSMYETNVKPPTAGKVGRALASICGPNKKKVRNPATGMKTDYHLIPINRLLDWVNESGYCTKEEMLSALSQDTECAAGPPASGHSQVAQPEGQPVSSGR
jgi:hypothetical protein